MKIPTEISEELASSLPYLANAQRAIRLFEKIDSDSYTGHYIISNLVVMELRISPHFFGYRERPVARLSERSFLDLVRFGVITEIEHILKWAPYEGITIPVSPDKVRVQANGNMLLDR